MPRFARSVSQTHTRKKPARTTERTPQREWSRWTRQRGGGTTATAMETVADTEGWTTGRQHRSGGFWLRTEIETDRGVPIPRGPGFGFAAAVREPLVKLRRPRYDFERWDWGYFVWPHDRLDANLEMRDSDPEATLEADLKAGESFVNQRTLQLESYETSQRRQQQYAAIWPCDHLAANLEMRDDGDPEATLEADRKASESFLNHGPLQLERSLMCQDDANLGPGVGRNSENKAKLGTDARKTKERRSTRRLKRSEMDRRTKAKQQEKENEGAALFRTPMPAIVNKKAVGPRSARRRRVFAEANRILDG
ncbi:uncharacterized protein [Zea mays]|uniref:Uncharacterized protein n=3 Tax=Zea mays TaxID=4577 RepID=A0A1R3LUW9_MAIZE|nr:uncharacterized protein LOC103637714 [Zea mays]ONM00121.1 hypothetical protein ZEAMMB73_Zm00001d030068 [Zea mays]|eukprot:XP_008658667.1 uncharacterized protein LOC103637714 [Zea mays]